MNRTQKQTTRRERTLHKKCFAPIARIFIASTLDPFLYFFWTH